jgi:hypothetical protein
MGSSSAEVKCLQEYLNSNGFQVSASGAGSPGSETSYFGGKTKAAVSAWQAANNVAPTAGYFGSRSRAKYAELSANTPPPYVPPTGGTNPPPTGGTTPPPTGTGLSVVAATQPSNSIAPESAARLPFTKITLTAGASDVTVNNITVERVGLGVDANLAGVVLVDENGTQIGIAKTLNSDHKANVGDPFVVKAGTSKTITIAGNMSSSLDSYAGQVIGLSVSSINTASGTVSGTLPIVGAYHTINASLSLGSVTVAVSSLDPNSAVTKEIGTTGYKFSGIRVTAGSAEKVYLRSVRWNQSGSAGSSDLANIKTSVDGGATYDATVSSDGKYYTTIFTDNGGNGILVDKGSSKDLYVSADIVGNGASGRTVKFDIYKTTDVYLTGETYGYGVTPPAGSGTASDSSSEFTASTPWFDGSKVTVSAGSVTTITRANSVPSGNIAVNISNQVLGGFEVDIKGEPVSVQQMIFTIATSSVSGSDGTLTNVSLYGPSGNVVAGPVDAAYSSADVDKVTFTDTVTFPIGKGVYTLKGKVASGIQNGTVYTLSSTPSSQWTNVTGQTSGNTITLSNGAFSMSAMTVKAGALSISVPSTPSAQNVVAGTTGYLFAKYQLDATASGEDVRFSSIPVQLTVGTLASGNQLSGCQLYDGVTALNTGSNVVNPSAGSAAALSNTFTLDQGLVVTKGTVKTVSLQCNIASTATSTFAWGIASSPSITVTGVSSGNEITESVTAATGQAMTIGTGSFTVALDSTSPSYSLVAPSASDVTLAVFKLRASNESLTLDKISLQLTGTTTSLNVASSSPSDLVDNQVTLWNGSQQVGTAVFTGSATTTNTTLTQPFVLTRDVDVKLTVKGKLAAIGTGQAGGQGHLILVDYNGQDSANTEAVGSGSGRVDSSSTADTSVGGVRVFKSYPTIALDTLPATGVVDGRLMRFKVTANSAGEIGLTKLAFTIATSSATVTNMNLYAYTDSLYSSPVNVVSSGGQVDSSANKSFTSAGDVYGHVEFTAKTSAGATTTIQIPQGATYYFTLTGTVAAASGATNYSVTTTLEGDAAYPSLADAVYMGIVDTIDSDANDDFIWSPNATSSSLSTHIDWTNGYAVPGLPAGGLINTRTN